MSPRLSPGFNRIMRSAPSSMFPPLLLPLILTLLPHAIYSSNVPVRVAFLTDCSKYSNWQSLGVIFSFKMSGQPGKLTRVMCCSQEDTKAYPPLLLQEVETHIAPSFERNPVTGDQYAAYNKPGAVMDWLEHVTPEEEYVLVLDSDMILRRPFLVEVMQPEPGLAIGNRYSYMIGVNNDLAMRHVPEVKPRNDTLAGPYGRRGDQVGGFFFIHRDDLKRMSKGWLKYTEDVRADPLAYKDSGDMYAIKPGDKPWISEMYGYAFGASTADVWHKWDTTSMIYPYGAYDHGSRGPTTMPKLMHYGLLTEVNNYKFDKHWFYELDVTTCPPWDTQLGLKQQKKAGLFDHPPRSTELKRGDFLPTYYRDLLVIETVATMNAGICDYHVRNCPPSQQLYDECKRAFDIYTEAADECRKVEAELGCSNSHAKCDSWAKQGECETNPEYMSSTCAKACKQCEASNQQEQQLKPVGSDLGKKLGELKRALEEAAQEKVAVAEEKKSVEVTLEASVQAPPPEEASAPESSPPPPAEKVEIIQAASPAALSIQVKAVPSPPLRMLSTKTRKELILRCYRMELRLEDVKLCVADAKLGYEFVQTQATKASLREEEALQLEDTGEVSSFNDPDDLTQSPATLSRPSSRRTQSRGLTGPPPRKAKWHWVGLGLLGAAFVVVILPRLRGLQRRQKSGMRLD